jgi:signal transduction histidine kinase
MISREGEAARPPLAYRLTGRQLLVVDSVTAALALVWTMFNVGFRHGFSYHAPTVAVALLATAAAAPLAVRRLWPLPVLAIITAAATALAAIGRAPLTLDITIGMAIYTVAAGTSRRVSLAALIITELVLAGSMLAAVASSPAPGDAMHTMLTAGSLWFIGDSTRSRRTYVAGLAEQAEQRRRAEDDRRRQAIREERVRIARELHDVLAHSLAVVTLRAGIGRKVMSDRPQEARLALEAVEVTGRGALDELRRIVGLLRDDDAGQPSLAPAPGIKELDSLADQVRAAGLPIELSVTGDPGRLPAAVALSVYRIVQEALTNVVKHAGPAQASVRVHIGADGVRVVVTDNGRGTAYPAGSGAAPDQGAMQHGIVGMSERATAFGGSLTAGSQLEGGFRVVAFLPVGGGAR